MTTTENKTTLKPGDIICDREFNYYTNSYHWTLFEVKNITPTGKIRLTNNKLLNELSPYVLFDEEMQNEYSKDEIKRNVLLMIDTMMRDKNIKRDLSFDEISKLGTLLESFGLSDKKWCAPSNQSSYNTSFNKYLTNVENLNKLKNK